MVRRLTSNGGPEEDEGQAECAILLLNLPCQHHKEQHVGQHMLEAGMDQDAGHPPVALTVSINNLLSIGSMLGTRGIVTWFFVSCLDLLCDRKVVTQGLCLNTCEPRLVT